MLSSVNLSNPELPVNYQNNYLDSNMGFIEPNFTTIQPQNNYNNPFIRNLSNNNIILNNNHQNRQNMISSIPNHDTNFMSRQEHSDQREHSNSCNMFSPLINQSNAHNLNVNQLD